ncbi:pantetheine-phosphate adenylyltransferase [Actinoplanes sp. NPDC026670]|uniref:pantetheine-phosphate adenylyltransferase n=1 Tax=Actinoplanes sp. NPDC026670 TaxID=3154700 RepID=UPI0033D02E7F
MPPTSARAVYPGTFAPFTPGHLDIVDRARRLFAHLTVLVAVNADKDPTQPGTARADAVRKVLPPGWTNVTVATWSGLTVDYCHRDHSTAIIRGVRNSTDALYEYQLAAMNETLGITTLLVPARPALANMSSTAVRTAVGEALDETG